MDPESGCPQSFRAKGVIFEGVKCCHLQPYGYRLVCKQLIPKGKAFISVPYFQIINKSNLEKQHPQLAQLFAKYRKQLDSFGTEQLYLLLGVIYKKANDFESEWFQIESHTFACFDESLIISAKDQMLLIQYRAFQEYCFKQFKGIYKVIRNNPQLFPKKDKSQYLEIYRWASNFIMTRGFGCGMQETALIPFLDCLNHSPTASSMTRLCLVNKQFETNPSEFESYCQNRPLVPNCTYEDYQFVGSATDLKIVGVQSKCSKARSAQSKNQQIKSQKKSENEECIRIDSEDSDSERLIKILEPPYTHVVLRAERDILPGEEVFFHYGARSNSYLLKWYGFVVQENPHDTLKVYIINESQTGARITLDPIQRPYTMVEFRQHEVCEDMLIWARKQSSIKKHLFTIPVSRNNQLMALKRCLDILDAFTIPCPSIDCSTNDGYFLNQYYKERAKLFYQQRYMIKECLGCLQKQQPIYQNMNMQLSKGAMRYLKKIEHCLPVS